MELMKPCETFVASYAEAVEEDKLYRPHVAQLFSDPATIVERSRHGEQGIDLPPGYVKATTLWLIDRQEFTGEISIRHELTPALMQFGGHIGYEVRWSACGQGYGKHMLSLGLEYAKSVLQLPRVLLTCDDDNVASIKVIEHNGGRLQDKVLNHLDRGTVLTRRYWIAIER